MSRKKKEGKMKPKGRVLYEPRHDGVLAEPPSRRKEPVKRRDSWHPEMILEDALDMPSEPKLTPDEFELVQQISSRAK